MFYLKFINPNDSRDFFSIPVYRILINSFSSDNRYCRDGINTPIQVLETSSAYVNWWLKIPNIPTYDELYSSGNKTVSYVYEKNSKITAKVYFNLYSTSMIGATNNRGFNIMIAISLSGTEVILLSHASNEPEPFTLTYGSDCFLGYDAYNKVFMSVPTIFSMIANVQLATGADYGTYNNVNVIPISLQKSDSVPFVKSMRFEDTAINYAKFYNTDVGKTIKVGARSNDHYEATLATNRLYIHLEEDIASDDYSGDGENDGTTDDSETGGTTGIGNGTTGIGNGNGDFDNTDDVITEDALPAISGTSNGLMTAWKITPSQLESLSKLLWEPSAWEAIKQYFTNPMESILGLAIIPVAPNTTSGTIHLGGYDTEITSQKISSDYLTFDFGAIPITQYYGSYLDFAPYTKISCVLPYIGEVELNVDQIMGKTLSISYHINCITGELCAYLKADESVFGTYSGNCIKQLPICQTDYSSIIGTSIQMVASAVLAGAALAIAPVPSALAGAGLQATTTATTHAVASTAIVGSTAVSQTVGAKPSYKHSSQLGTGVGQLAPQVPFLIITRPNLDLADDYKSLVGYPCNKNILLSTCKGYTQVEASHLSIPSATLDELGEIKELLLKGVII